MSNAATPPLHIGDTFGKGFESFLNNAVPMVLGLLILIFLGGFSLGICAPPLVVGYCKMHLRIARGETVQAGEIFDGFQFFLEAWLLALAIFGLVLVGTIVCVIPGIVASFLIFWAWMAMADGDRDPISCIKRSVEAFTGDIGANVVFVIVYSIVSGSGSLVVLGGLATVPLAYSVQAHAFDRLFNPESQLEA